MLDHWSSILNTLKKTYPNAKCALKHANPLQLLIATILSAQCTDKRVNTVTPTLFKKYKTAKDFARAKPSQLQQMIRSTGFFRQKAKSIQESCKKILEKFNGQVPDRMEDLLTLTGVARKTANVVLGTAYHKISGIVVDTHVRRIANRLGFTKQKDPVKIEQDLMRKIPKKDWIWFSHALIIHGRTLCKARFPLCHQCPLHKICPASEV